MKHRALGRSDLSLPAVTFGAYALGGGYWGSVDDDEAERAVHAALDAGMNAFDTAPVYGFGHSEEVLGRALASRRDEALILTKVGLRWDDLSGADDFRMPDVDGTPRRVERNCRPESIRVEVERSLTRLGTGTIDLVQVHARDPRTPVAETMGALSELHAEGLVRAIGVSNYTIAELDEALRALGDVPLASDQPQYSLLERGIERDVLPWARHYRVGLLVYAPLEQGLLTGKVGEERHFAEGEGRGRKATFLPANRQRVNALLDQIVAPVAAAHQATIAQTVLAWTTGEPGVTTALVGARTAEQARENAGAGAIELGADERGSIGDAFAELRLERPRPTLGSRLRTRLRRLRRRGG
ncbi:MAG: aldo/keto reductase [Planctomycetota bacterium]